MFVVSCGFAVDRAFCPAVILDEDIASSKGDHRLDSYGHTGFENDTVTTSSVVAYLGILVHLASDTVSHELAYYSVAGFFAVVLDGERHIA